MVNDDIWYILWYRNNQFKQLNDSVHVLVLVRARCMPLPHSCPKLHPSNNIFSGMHKCHNLPPYKEDAKVGMVQFKKNLRNQKLKKILS